MSDYRQNRGSRLIRLIQDIGLGAAAPVAVFGLLAGVWIFWPIESVQTQTGYRGTGMVQFTPEEDAIRLAALNVIPESEEPYVPAEGDELAKDVYENVQVLGDVTEDNFNRVMLAITEWVSPEQGCAYCHGEEGDFASDEYYPKIVARRMIQMTQNINENWKSHVGDVGVTCYTCHRGNPVPEYYWHIEPRPRGPKLLGDNTMLQNRAAASVGYTSLPGDPLTKYLLGDTEIRIADTAPRVRGTPSDGKTPTIQDTEWTYGLMFHFSTSLGVNCTYCHNSRVWGSWEQSPPVRVKAWYAIRMLRDVNANYMHNLDAYPDNRLGPLGDAPKASCATCHQGVNKPLYGQSMIGDWPELQTSGKPVYEGESAAAPTGTDHAAAATTARN